MLEKITWTQYWTAIGAASALYYSAIGIKFYRGKVNNLFTKRLLSGNPSSTKFNENLMGAIEKEDTPLENIVASEQESTPSDTNKISATAILHKTEIVADQITETLTALGEQKDISIVIHPLKEIISENNRDGNLTPFKETINWHITQTTLENCGIALEDEDLEILWKS